MPISKRYKTKVIKTYAPKTHKDYEFSLFVRILLMKNGLILKYQKNTSKCSCIF